MFPSAIRLFPTPRPQIPIAKHLGTTPRSAFPQKLEKSPKGQSAVPLSRRPVGLLLRIRKVSGGKHLPVNRLEDSEASIVPNRKDVEFQDVRGRGPLFNLRMMEFESDPEKAKQQWHNLCVEYKIKEEVAVALWEENQALKTICKDLRLQYKASQERLKSVLEVVEVLEAENARLYEEIKYAQGTTSALQRDAMRLDDGSSEPEAVDYYNLVGRRRRTWRHIQNRYWARSLGFGLSLLSMASLCGMVSYLNI